MKIALFDFDGTLIQGDSIVYLLQYAWQKKQISPSLMLHALIAAIGYALKLTSASQSKAEALRFLGKKSEEEQRHFCRGFVDQKLIPVLYQDGIHEIQNLKNEGYQIWIVSASTENYMEYVSEALHADVLLCTRLDEKLRPVKNCKGEEKVRRIQEKLTELAIDKENVTFTAYGDSKSDLAMLSFSNTGTLVNAKKRLIAKAGLPCVSWQ